MNILNDSRHKLPKYETANGMDLKANLEETIIIKPLGRVLIPTGLSIELPEGYEAQIRPKKWFSLEIWDNSIK